MNDDAGRFYEDGRNEPLGAELSQRLSESLKLPFLFLLFFGYKRYAYTQKRYAEESYSYSQEERKIFLKIARKRDCDNGFTKVGNHLSDKFSAFFADNNHHVNNIIHRFGCQDMLSDKTLTFS